MGRQTVYINDEATYDHGLDGQRARIRVNAQVDSYGFANIPHTFVSVNLAGTNVEAAEAGKLAIDRDDLRGWYTEWADVQIAVDSDDFVVEQDSPATTMGSSTTTSTTAISVNESLGTFGPTPTTNIGGGITIGSSFSRNLTDFRVENTSTNAVAEHRYKLAATSGGPYTSSQDLIDMSAGGQFTGCLLHHPPDLAVDNLPVLSQVIFMSRSPHPPDVNLAITVKHHLVKVEKTFKLFVVTRQTSTAEWTHISHQKIALSGLVA